MVVVKHHLYPSSVPVARHGRFGIAVAVLYRGPEKTKIVPIESPGSVYWW